MPTTIAILIAAILILKYLPVRRSTLIEGVFNRTERGWSMSCDKTSVVYFFDSYCRACLEDPGKRNPIMGCHEGVVLPALKLESFEPMAGDSIKIITWKNVFGRVLMYRIHLTFFAEETQEQQMREYEEEERAYLDASERREALLKGMTIEDVRANRRARTERIKKIWNDADEGKIIDKFRARRWEGLGCVESYSMDVLEYAETGTLPHESDLAHLRECNKCLNTLDGLRAAYLKAPERPEDCLSEDEIASIRLLGKLPFERSLHIDQCYHCRVTFLRRREEHLRDPPGAECLTQDDRHVIHTTGVIPEERRAHVVMCWRCDHAVEKESHTYVDTQIPLPPFPTIRLKSLKKNREIA